MYGELKELDDLLYVRTYIRRYECTNAFVLIWRTSQVFMIADNSAYARKPLPKELDTGMCPQWSAQPLLKKLATNQIK